MAIINAGKTGTPLSEIIERLGNKSYSYIECRIQWEQNGKKYDEFWGACAYNGKTKALMPLDMDSYSLEDLYEKWEEWQNGKGEDCLTVWEAGSVEQNDE